MGRVAWTDLQKAAGDAGFDALPAAMYDVIVDTAEATQSSSGKDMIKATFKVETGPYANKKVFNQFVISPENANALAFFFRHMAAMGLNDAYFAANPELADVARALIGKRARVKLGIREWNGQDRNNVEQVLPPEGGQVATAPGSTPGVPSTAPSVTPPSPSTAPVVTPSPTPTPSPVPAPPSMDDDLPF